MAHDSWSEDSSHHPLFAASADTSVVRGEYSQAEEKEGFEWARQQFSSENALLKPAVFAPKK